MRRAYWVCWDCGKLTDGRSGLDDAMDCFCARCSLCGGLTDMPGEGDGCQCDDPDDDPYDEDGAAA